MNNTPRAQDILLRGWRADKDAFNYLHQYFNNVENEDLLTQAMENVYHSELTNSNKPAFLKVLAYEFKKQGPVAVLSKQMAYSMVASLAGKQPAIVQEAQVTETYNFMDALKRSVEQAEKTGKVKPAQGKKKPAAKSIKPAAAKKERKKA